MQYLNPHERKADVAAIVGALIVIITLVLGQYGVELGADVVSALGVLLTATVSAAVARWLVWRVPNEDYFTALPVDEREEGR